MRKIRLYGVLAKKFGKEFELDVKSPAEAVRALCAVVPGFKRHLVQYSEPGYTVRVGKECRGVEELHDPVGKRVIHIAPVVAGSNATVRTIVGVTLAIIGVMTGNPYLTTFGVSMALGGVAEMLTPMPKMKSTERPENLPSYAFDGPVNTVAQGNAVPVGYGRLIVGSQVVSAQLFSEDYVA